MEYGKKNGYDLACHVLHHEHGGVEALLRLAGSESLWLEVKAGMDLLPEDRKKGETLKDLYWNIAKSVIGIMNRSGGILLIGIQDNFHDAVPLEENDPDGIIGKEGLEAFRRKVILGNIWPDNKRWKLSNVTWFIDPVPEADLVEVVGCQYQGKNIAAILIKPAQKCVHLIWKKEQIESEYLFVRELGEVGKVRHITRFNEIAEYESKREIETAFLGELYARFEREVGEKSEAGTLDRAIRQYYERFAGFVSKNRLFERSCFTPLDGSGDLEAEDMDDFMSPEAEEIFGPEEDDWLDPEDHDDEDDEDKPDPEDDDESDEDDEDEGSAYREHRSGDLITLMEEIPRMLVLGEPGGGKTTTLINFTLRFQKENPGEPLILAVYIPMGRWIAGGSVEQLLNKSTGLSPEQWSILIRQNRLRLVIDAFNECPDMYQDAALLNIRNFLQAHPDLPGVISSRTAERLKELRLPMFTVEPMDQEHQKKYLTRYLNDEAAAEELLNRLNAMSGGTVLAANPMLLRMIVEVFRDSHQLPSGRAGLYHQWLKQWYDREYKKAKKAGSPLPWDFHAALDILSELALRGRFQGYRDIPLGFAREILQDRGPECIDKLCQGPVVTIDDEFIRFRHETFQEYLCAEKLVQKPELVEQIRQTDAEQWAMVLAYASELQWPLPDPLWRFAWKVDKWFGVALTDDQRAFSTDKSQFKPKDMIYFHALQGTWDGVSALNLNRRCRIRWSKNQIRALRYIRLKKYNWYSADIKKIISYIISANDEIYTRWLKFELCLLCLCLDNIHYFIYFCQKSIALKFTLQSKKQTLEQCLSVFLHSPKIPDDLRTKFQDIIFRIKDLLQGINAGLACQLIQTSLIRKEVFSDRVPKWIAKMTPGQAKQLIDLGLATKEDFAYKVPKWIAAKVTPGQAKHLIDLGLATKEDFAHKVPEWISAKVTLGQAKQLIDLGLATKEDFADRIFEWATAPGLAKQLIEMGLATKEDFADKVPEWIKQADPKTAKKLIKSGLAAKEDFAYKVPEWISAKVTPGQAKQLIDLGLATKEDFADRIFEWATVPGLAKQLIEMGLATKEDFADKVLEWIKQADTKTAKQLIKFGLATKEDFADRIFEWATTPSLAKQLIGMGLATKEDFADKKVKLIAKAKSPKQKRQLVVSGLVSQSELDAFEAGKYSNPAESTAVHAIVEQEKSPAPEPTETLSTEDDTNSNNDQKGNTKMVSFPLFSSKSILKWTAQTIRELQSCANAGNSARFTKILPPRWPWYIQFVREQDETLSKIVSYLFYLAEESEEDMDQFAKEYRTAELRLVNILEHEVRFYCIKMHPVTAEPVFPPIEEEKVIPPSPAGNPLENEKTPVSPIPFLNNKPALVWTSKIIFSLCGPTILASPTKFTKQLPSEWDLKIPFCETNRDKLLKIAALLQSLSACNPESDKYKKNQTELTAILESDPGFQCIKKFPVTSDPKTKKAAPTAITPKEPVNQPDRDTASVLSAGLLENKKIMAWTCIVLNRLIPPAALGKSSEFDSMKPSNWIFDITFCSDKRLQFVKITDLLRELSDRNSDPLSPKYQQIKDELLALLDSDPRFQCIKTYPVKSDPNQKEPPAKPVRQTTKRKKQIAKPPAPKKQPPGIIKGFEYDPEIDFDEGMSAIGGVTDFSRNADHIRIYIDETWPKDQDRECDIGVISGIVWQGEEANYDVLPWVRTHLKDTKEVYFQDAIHNLLINKHKVFPFAFPIYKKQLCQEDYPELLRIALITLLGWILPQNGNECKVDIFCEGINTSQMEPGKNCANQFKEIRNTLGLTACRMQRWQICTFTSLKEEETLEGKNFEYIPYADAVGYLCVPTEKAQQWGAPFHVESWPGYVPLSRDLLRQLCSLDTCSLAGYADELFEFAKTCQHTKLFYYVLDQAFFRAGTEPEFKAALFEKLEKMFEAKERDLPLLNHICRELVKKFPLEEFSRLPRQKLIRILVELQNANHAGDPEIAGECVALYEKNRDELFNQDPALCAYADMNLAVHYNDQFEFEKAAAICRPWESHVLFSFLIPENRGRILSSIGQSYSIPGDYGKAEEYFRRAIEIFNDPANPLPGQADHTRVYLALNALDAGNFEAAAEFAEQVFGCSFAEAVAKYAGNTDKPFHHHLLVKNLYFNPKAASLRPAYLQTAPKWTGEEQHPWELIELYRALLLHEAGKTAECRTRFEALHSLYAELGSGAIMQLLKAFALTVQMILETDSADELRLERDSLLDQAVKFLPETEPICRKLREAKQLDPDFWKLLPFNYK